LRKVQSELNEFSDWVKYAGDHAGKFNTEIKGATTSLGGMNTRLNATSKRLSNWGTTTSQAAEGLKKVKDQMDGVIRSQSLKALVDSVARFGGDSELLKRAAVAVQQMSGKGVVSMEELRQQLGEAVPNAMKAMADAAGITMGELTKAVSSGTVEAKQALSLMFVGLRAENENAAKDMM
ncbi:tape measure protein, partial [Klebsiella pneumoniae]|uniref:tape measure protein n=1 Tax=Klebsiella pneumoniae TaxID=573 RepID=UPI00114D6C70